MINYRLVFTAFQLPIVHSFSLDIFFYHAQKQWDFQPNATYELWSMIDQSSTSGSIIILIASVHSDSDHPRSKCQLGVGLLQTITFESIKLACQKSHITINIIFLDNSMQNINNNKSFEAITINWEAFKATYECIVTRSADASSISIVVRHLICCCWMLITIWHGLIFVPAKINSDIRQLLFRFNGFNALYSPFDILSCIRVFYTQSANGSSPFLSIFNKKGKLSLSVHGKISRHTQIAAEKKKVCYHFILNYRLEQYRGVVVFSSASVIIFNNCTEWRVGQIHFNHINCLAITEISWQFLSESVNMWYVDTNGKIIAGFNWQEQAQK